MFQKICVEKNTLPRNILKLYSFIFYGQNEIKMMQWIDLIETRVASFES